MGSQYKSNIIVSSVHTEKEDNKNSMMLLKMFYTLLGLRQVRNLSLSWVKITVKLVPSFLEGLVEGKYIDNNNETLEFLVIFKKKIKPLTFNLCDLWDHPRSL